jgi:magnesium-transporting ATPase (P-type)
VPCGSSIEVALLKFLTLNQVSAQDYFVQRERMFKLKATVPFSSERKRMTVAYQMTVDDKKIVRVVVKGAPESLIKLCVATKDTSNQRKEFEGDKQEGQDFLERVVSVIAKDGLKPLCLCYKDMDAD